jgi:hypothetical protein
MLVVKISPFYTGRGWFDPRSGINFLKQYGEIEIPLGKDIRNIQRDIRQNALIVVKGSVEEYIAASSIAEEPVAKVEVKLEPAQEIKPEPAKVEKPKETIETPAENKVEEPKPKPKKKAPAKSTKKEE